MIGTDGRELIPRRGQESAMRWLPPCGHRGNPSVQIADESLAGLEVAVMPSAKADCGEAVATMDVTLCGTAGLVPTATPASTST